MPIQKRKRWGTAAGSVTVHIRNVPPDVRAQFKAFCARRGYTVESTIIALMRQAIHENKWIPAARANVNRKIPPATTS